MVYIIILSVLLVWLWAAGAFATVAMTTTPDDTWKEVAAVSISWPFLATIGFLLALRDLVRR